MHRVMPRHACGTNESAKTTQALAGAESRTAPAVVPRADGDEALVCRARRSPAPPLSPDPTVRQGNSVGYEKRLWAIQTRPPVSTRDTAHGCRRDA